VRKDGVELTVLVNVWPLFGPGGEVAGASTVTHDITAEAWGARERRQAEARFQAVGHRLNASVRPGDTVARFGGDEFVIVCNDVTVESMTRLASRIGEAVGVPFLIQDREIPVQASLGITLSRPGSTGPSLLSEADAAMYRAKDLGRGRVAVFDDSLRTRAEVMLDRERALRLALHFFSRGQWADNRARSGDARPGGR
jgi:predicted signal transduction protein with EAL and GGDEF domain